MTNSWSGVRGSILLLALGVLFLLMLALTATEEAKAGTSYIVGDWTISNETVRIVDSTIDVAGNITVGYNGGLVLENATLTLNSTQEGEGILVGRGGNIEASNSTIAGKSWLTVFRSLGDIKVTDSKVTGMSSMVLDDGQMICTNSLLGCVLVTRTDIDFTNVSLNIRLEYNHPSVVRNISCRMNGCNIYNMYIGENGAVGHSTRAVIENCTFAYCEYALTMEVSGGLDLTVRGCTFERNRVAMDVYYLRGGMVRLENNTLRGQGKDGWGRGIGLYLWGRPSIEMTGNEVSDYNVGYRFVACEGPIYSASFGNLSAKDCYYAVMAYSTLPNFLLTIHNSTFKNIDTCFYISDGAFISVFDTEHTPGSGLVVDQGNWIRAYTTLAIGTVSWAGGDSISTGALVLSDDDGGRVTYFDLSNLAQKTILGWEMTSRAVRILRDLIPSMTIGGTEFIGEDIGIWGAMPVDVAITDHVVPGVEVDDPVDGAILNKGHLAVQGRYSEEGSGLVNMTYLLDEDPPRDFSGFGKGIWTLLLSGLFDGEHDLWLWATDGVDNVAERVRITFLIDTVNPIVELEEVPGGVNESTLRVVGRTEPMATIEVSGRLTSADESGRFEVWVDLAEGPNLLRFRVTDVAGNENLTTRQVILDTMAPCLTVTSPSSGLWTNLRSIIVKGWTEPGVQLHVNGEPVQLDGIHFHHLLNLTEGEFRIDAMVTDPGDNIIRVDLVLHVDWEEPSLNIEAPADPLTYTKFSSVQLLGTAEDRALDAVTINGEQVDTEDGTFLTRLDLREGTSEFNITATDAAGNRNWTLITIIKDSIPPTYDVRLTPLEGGLVDTELGLYCTGTHLDVEIVASEDILIDVGGPDLGPGLNITIRFKLDEGANEILMTICDLAGNEGNPFELMVILDTKAPQLTVVAPRSGARTKGSLIIVHGLTEPGIILSINDLRFPIPENGTFIVELPLEVGPNRLHVVVADHAGHCNETTILVTREEPVGEPRVGPVTLWGAMLVIMAVAAVAGWTWMQKRRRRCDPI